VPAPPHLGGADPPGTPGGSADDAYRGAIPEIAGARLGSLGTSW